MNSISSLLAKAEQIRIETLEDNNDAERVGSTLKEIINFIDLTLSGVYDVTTAVPLPANQYYTATTARAAVPLNIRKKGLVISFNTSATAYSIQEFYQNEVTAWATAGNWRDNTSKVLAAVATVQSKLDAETAARTAADTNLQNQLTGVASGYIDAIAYNAAAPTPGKSGYYEFSSTGSCSWITGGAVTVKIGDRVALKYTAPNTYVYTYIAVDLSGLDKKLDKLVIPIILNPNLSQLVDNRNWANSQEYPPGIITKVKLNAYESGVVHCALLRKLSSAPTFEIIKNFDINVVAGINDISVNVEVLEVFYFSTYNSSARYFTSPGPIGYACDLYGSYENINANTSWQTFTGRGTNIEVQVDTQLLIKNKIVKVEPMDTRLIATEASIPNKVDKLVIPIVLNPNLAQNISGRNWLTGQEYPAGIIKKIKIKAVSSGTIKCALLRKLTDAPTFSTIKNFNIDVVTGVNDLSLNVEVSEPFYFCTLYDSVGYYSSPGPIGYNANMYSSYDVFNNSTVWDYFAGRGTNVEVQVDIMTFIQNKIVKVEPLETRMTAAETSIPNKVDKLSVPAIFNQNWAQGTDDRNWATSTEYPAGIITRLRLKAVSTGVINFVVLRKLTDTPTFEPIKKFAVNVVAGINDIVLNITVAEKFRISTTSPSVGFYTSPSAIGYACDLYFSYDPISKNTVWQTLAGRGTNIEFTVDTVTYSTNKIAELASAAYNLDIRLSDSEAKIGSLIVPTLSQKASGKSICLCGDSITDFCDSPSSNGTQYVGYDQIIQQKITFTSVVNKGFSGIRLAQAGGFAASQISGLPVCDIYSIFLGTNDWALETNTVIGTLDDYKNNTGYGTFFGAYRLLIDGIKAKNANAIIWLLTPTQRYNISKDPYISLNNNGQTLIDYVNAVISIGLYTGLKVIDLFRHSGINATNITKCTYDNLHPTSVGYKKIGDAIVYDAYDLL